MKRGFKSVAYVALENYLASLGNAQLEKCPGCHAEEQLIASLPSFAEPAATWEEFIDEGFFVALICTPKERREGFRQTHHTLHIPGKLSVRFC